jgi:hypothetical protein
VLTKAGFTIEAESDILRNPGDDHTKGVRDPSVARRTDQLRSGASPDSRLFSSTRRAGVPLLSFSTRFLARARTAQAELPLCATRCACGSFVALLARPDPRPCRRAA